jgi:hypothetical protein
MDDYLGSPHFFLVRHRPSRSATLDFESLILYLIPRCRSDYQRSDLVSQCEAACPAAHSPSRYPSCSALATISLAASRQPRHRSRFDPIHFHMAVIGAACVPALLSSRVLPPVLIPCSSPYLARGLWLILIPRCRSGHQRPELVALWRPRALKRTCRQGTPRTPHWLLSRLPPCGSRAPARVLIPSTYIGL